MEFYIVSSGYKWRHFSVSIYIVDVIQTILTIFGSSIQIVEGRIGPDWIPFAIISVIFGSFLTLTSLLSIKSILERRSPPHILQNFNTWYALSFGEVMMYMMTLVCVKSMAVVLKIGVRILLLICQSFHWNEVHRMKQGRNTQEVDCFEMEYQPTPFKHDDKINPGNIL